MPEALKGRKPESVANALIEARARNVPRLSYLLSSGDDKSIRDLLTHRKNVPAGTLNLSPQRGLFFAGGGENLRPGADPKDDKVSVSDAINQRLVDLQETVDDLLNVFVEAAVKA